MWKGFELQFTEKAKYIPRNPLVLIGHYALTWAVMPVIYLVLWIRWGFRVEGRKNLRSVRGRPAVTVSNHVHDMDSIMVTAPFWPMTPYVVARKHIVEALFIGIFNWLIGAVPLPEDHKNLRNFQKAIKEFLDTSRHKLHVFPEGEIVPYAHELRDFRNGAFRMALSSSVPVVPMVFVCPAPGRIILKVGKPIELEEVPELCEEGVAMSRRARILNAYTREKMREMLTDYYKSHS